MSDYRAGFVALLGQPNAGKSTLLNALVGEKVAIVSPKPQTTRQRMLGLWNSEAEQIILVDAPGWVSKAHHELHGFLQEEFQESKDGADVLALVVDVTDRDFLPPLKLWSDIKLSRKPSLVILTKVDQVNLENLEIIKKQFEAEGAPVCAVSALQTPEQTREVLRPLLRELLPPSEAPLYDLDTYTTHTVRELSAEIIREKCFELLRQEIPYGIGVNIQKFSEQTSITHIDADIWVSKESHKGMVIGKGASMLKDIGTKSRVDLERLLDQKVFLRLSVKVKEDWNRSKNKLLELGYLKQGDLS